MIDNENYSTSYNIGQTSLTFTHEVLTTTNRLLVVSTFHQTNENISNVTYNGVNMTFLARTSQEGGTRRIEMWYLVNPDEGTHDVVITRATGSGALRGDAASYSGVYQTSPIDNSDTTSLASGTAFTNSLTTSIEDCWLIVYARNDTDNYTSTVTGGVIRSAAGNPSLFDSNVALSAGSNSIIVNSASSAAHIGIIAGIIPDTYTPTTTVANNPTLLTLGVG